jgi:DNA-binding IclR family transcriptional regulator
VKLNDTEQLCLDCLASCQDWLSYPALVVATGLDDTKVNDALDALLEHRLIEERLNELQPCLPVYSVYSRVWEYRCTSTPNDQD